jgi:hypothetical protein
VEAVQWTEDNEAELVAFTGDRFRRVNPSDRGGDPDVTAEVWDVLHNTWVGMYTDHWVVRGVKGENYPVEPGVLAQTYELVSTDD